MKKSDVIKQMVADAEGFELHELDAEFDYHTERGGYVWTRDEKQVWYVGIEDISADARAEILEAIKESRS